MVKPNKLHASPLVTPITAYTGAKKLLPRQNIIEYEIAKQQTRHAELTSTVSFNTFPSRRKTWHSMVECWEDCFLLLAFLSAAFSGFGAGWPSSGLPSATVAIFAASQQDTPFRTQSKKLNGSARKVELRLLDCPDNCWQKRLPGYRGLPR